eukprot:m51a1_g6973 hypothetical protein (779) ;mRNA; r:106959-109657
MVKCYLQFVSVGERCNATTPCVLVFTDTRRYLVACGEGAQRLCAEHRVRLARVDAVVLPSLTCGPRGTRALAGSFGLFVHGVSRLSYAISEHGSACRACGTPCRCVFDDGTLRCVSLGHSHSAQPSSPHSPEAKRPRTAEEPFPLRVGCVRDDADDFDAAAPPSPTSAWSCCPECSGAAGCGAALLALHWPGAPGKFDVARAEQLGVPKGPLRGRLVKGESVALPGGAVVRPSDCLGAAEPGPIFLLAHCETLADVAALPRLPAEYAAGGELSARVKCIVHTAPAEVLLLQTYCEWAATLGGPGVTHIVAGAGAALAEGREQLASASGLQARLHQLHPEVFPLLHVCAPTVDSSAVRFLGGVVGPVVRAESMLKFHLSVPQAGVPVGLDRSEVCDRAARAAYDEQLVSCADPLLCESFRDARAAAGAPDPLPPLPECSGDVPQGAFAQDGRPAPARAPVDDGDFEVAFLGTGSSYPSKYRNVSSTLLDVGSGKFVLLDCGEGTFGQLCRHYGTSMALDIATRDLAIIFVSHMHADHHLGLPRFLELRCSAGPAAPPLVVVGPRRLQTWLSSYAAVSGRPWLVPSAFVHSADLDGGLRAEDEMDHDGAPAAALPPVLADALDWIGVQLKTAPVEHCHDAYGVAVTHRSGWKIVFSGDTTAPCSSLVELGQGATLLLHEATFDDTMGAEAAAKRHSTVSGALAAAKQMKAEAVVLTHFSQRYPKMGAVAEPGGDKDVSGMHVGMAFDHMRVRRAHLPALHCLIPSLNLLFAGEDDKAADE